MGPEADTGPRPWLAPQATKVKKQKFCNSDIKNNHRFRIISDLQKSYRDSSQHPPIT
jgi:hypothetical protein